MTASVLFGMAAAEAVSAMYNVATALQSREVRDVPAEHGLRSALLGAETAPQPNGDAPRSSRVIGGEP